MRPFDATEHLRGLLTGVPLDEDDGWLVGTGEHAAAAWEAFKTFAAAPADEPFRHRGRTLRADPEEEGDLLLFETSVDHDSGDFVLSFARQFFLADESGEHEGMFSLELAVGFAPEEALTALPRRETWGCGGPPWTGPEPFGAARDWVAEVEADEVFRRAFAEGTVRGFRFGQDDEP